MAPSHQSVLTRPAASAGGGGGSGGGGTVPAVPGWTLEYNEDFLTDCTEGHFMTTYAATMDAYADGTPDTWANGNGGTSQYSTHNLSVSGSILNVRVYCDSSGSYGAALIPIWPGKASYHGYNQFRRATYMRCVSPVNWQKDADLFWPDSESWNDGEIDFGEENLNGTVNGYNHHPGNPSVADGYEGGTTTLATWHEYVIEKTLSSLKFIIDGTTVKTITNNLATATMHPVHQIERVLSSTPRPVVGQTCNVQIDYIRMWLPS